MNKRFDNLSKSAAPSDAFKGRLWQRLDAELEAVHIHKRPWYQRFAMPVAAVAIVGLLGGSGTYAYASPNVAPDSSLYQVKTGIEWVEERFHRSPESLATFHHRMAERRHAEYERLDRAEVRHEVFQRLQHHLELSDEQIEALHERPELKERLQERSRTIRQRHQEGLERQGQHREAPVRAPVHERPRR